MNQFYNGVKQLLLTWALGEKPSGVTLRCATVSTEYVFNADHGKSQVTDIVSDDLMVATVNNGVVDLADYVLDELTPGDTIQGFVLYFNWGGGSKLICFIDSATDLSLPLVVEQQTLQVRWDAAGVFRI